MWMLILEALLAGGLFVFIVWWTMFAGRPKGERSGPRQTEHRDEPPH
jgi:hypothetical protein